MRNHKTTPTSQSPDERYEHTDASATVVTIMAVMTVVLVLVSLPVVVWTFDAVKRFSEPAQALSPLALREPPPEPRLLVNEQADFAKFLKSQQATLNEYRWINQPEGVVRIPIDRAISLLEERGLPQPKQPTKEPAPPASEGAPSGISNEKPPS